MNRKHLLVILLSAGAMICIGLFLTQGPVQHGKATTVTAKTLTSKIKQVSKAPSKTTSSALASSSHSESQSSASDVTLDEIYDSLNLDTKLSHDLNARLEIARERGASSEEIEFRLVASILADVETKKDSSSQKLASELAGMLREMRGQDIYSIAAEMAYEPFPMLSQAAVDAAVAADLATNPENQAGNAQTVTLMTPGNDDEAQALLDSELKKKPAD